MKPIETKRTFNSDLSFGENNEDDVKAFLEAKGWKVKGTSRTAITDFELINPEGIKSHAELKTRTNAHDKYETTMIGYNKLKKAQELFETKGEKTYFLFKFTDGLFLISPLDCDYDDRQLKQGRWDRAGFDKPKDYIYYNVDKLINIS